jgi:hypothetical protein
LFRLQQKPRQFGYLLPWGTDEVIKKVNVRYRIDPTPR